MLTLPNTISPKGHYFHVAKFSFHLTKHAVRTLVTTAVVGSLSFGVINAVLFFIQLNSLPLFLKVGQLDLSLKAPDEAKVLLANYSRAQQFKLSVENENYSAQAEAIGIKFDVAAILDKAQNPEGWQKLPLINTLANLKAASPPQYQLSSTELKNYLSKVPLPKKIEAISASVVVPAEVNQPAYISAEKAGSEYSLEQLSSQVSNEITDKHNLNIIARAQVLQPKVKAEQLKGALARTNALLASDLTIGNGAASYKLTAEDLRRITVVSANEDGVPQPTVDRRQVVEVLRAHSNIFYVAPVVNKVSVLDGNIISTSAGSSGQAINVDKTADLIVKALEEGRNTEDVAMATLSPGTTYLKNYTATSAGLLALIKDFAANHPGSYKVVTYELGDNRSAYFNQDVPIVPASTYKVFLAYVALKKVEQGVFSLNSQTSAGSLDYCIQKND